jgi:predicted ATP-grasp superfamily ATP-dependent carboligase
MKDIFRFSPRSGRGLPKFENSSLIVGWDKDPGQVGLKVIEYLNIKMNGTSFCEIEPVDFFSLEGVTVEEDMARFPYGKFYSGDRKDIVIFEGSPPLFERYRYLSAISDLALRCCNVKHICTISGTASSIAHTSPRKILAVFNQQKFQKELRGFGLKYITWQGTPAINSYLLWVAERKGIPAVSFWTEIPFYLAAQPCWVDFQAVKRTLCFFNKRFNLVLDLKDLDEQIARQNARINRLRQDDSAFDRSIGVLENGLPLTEEEQMGLIKAVSELLESGQNLV